MHVQGSSRCSDAKQSAVRIELWFVSWVLNFPRFTSTLIPSWGKIWSLGLSLGTYLKNSCSLRYHLTLYRVSPSMSNLEGKYQRFIHYCIMFHWKFIFDHCMQWDKHWFSKMDAAVHQTKNEACLPATLPLSLASKQYLYPGGSAFGRFCIGIIIMYCNISWLCLYP